MDWLREALFSTVILISCTLSGEHTHNKQSVWGLWSLWRVFNVLYLLVVVLLVNPEISEVVRILYMLVLLLVIPFVPVVPGSLGGRKLHDSQQSIRPPVAFWSCTRVTCMVLWIEKMKSSSESSFTDLYFTMHLPYTIGSYMVVCYPTSDVCKSSLAVYKTLWGVLSVWQREWKLEKQEKVTSSP